MEWFKQHLNWTLAISSGLATLILILLILIGGWADSEVVSLIIGLPNIIVIASWWIVCGWVLNKKNRSLAWLFILLVPLGWIALLFLKNQIYTKQNNN